MTDPSTATVQSLLQRLPPPLPPPEIDPDLLDVESLKVIARLHRHGYTAYLVGGCVRDLLCGAHPKDYDVATDAHPEQIRDVFRNSRLIGRRFRLAHVYFPGGKFIEVATFRATPPPEAEAAETADTGAGDTGAEEGAVEAASDGPDLLLTDDNLFGSAEEDARRRDFTINGLFYDVFEGRVIDFVGGRDDLLKRKVRTIGDPEIRMQEDPVRGLRAARIAAKLGFDIDEDTFRAMQHHADELPRCAPARVLEETLKLLRSGTSQRAFALLRQAGLLRVLLPPIEEALVQGGPEAERQFLGRLGVLDQMVAEKQQVSDAVMLASLLSFLPTHALVRKPAEGEDEEEEPDDLAAVLPSADKVLSQMSQHARLPRRVADRVRAMIGSQKLFTQSPKKKRRRGGSGGFVRTPHFAESFLLFEISARATGTQLDVVERWRAKARAALAQAAEEPEGAEREEAPVVAKAPPPPPQPAPAPEENEKKESGEAGAEGEAKKRRRRGGRRHRKPKGAGEAGEGSAESAEGGSDAGSDDGAPTA